MSSESSLSQASTKVNGENTAANEPKAAPREAFARVAEATTAQDILLFLVAFRILNALSVKTFFQPDEFFQSLEPAWQMVFGQYSGAWITWEWKNQLRSAIHPAIFASIYFIANFVAEALRLTPMTRGDLLVAAPKTTQAVFAAIGDYYTWKLAGRVYGLWSNEAWVALALTVLSPWQWFCSTRTLSNCLETTLTIIALYLWPWQWSVENEDGDSEHLRTSGSPAEARSEEDEVVRLRRCLFLAALACVLRPTNLLIWLCLVMFTTLKPATGGWLIPFPWTAHPILVQFTAISFGGATKKERMVLFREAALCGSIILTLALLIDRLYYQIWTFPPLKFLYFNIAQSLAVFYGRNDWHYYLSQGYPLLLTTALPFALIGIYRPLTLAVESTTKTLGSTVTRQLASISIFVPAVLSLISHKEVRFIYPLLPSLHVLAAPTLTDCFVPALSTYYCRTRSIPLILKRLLLAILILVNLTIAFYTTLVHNRGPLSVLAYLREEHNIHYLSINPISTPQAHQYPPVLSTHNQPSLPASSLMTVGFLMPCHSTPWRSHLIHPSIFAWALSCEPPLHLNATAKAAYLDEADQFYADPAVFLRMHMVGGLRRAPRPAGLFLPPQRGGHMVEVPPRAGSDRDGRLSSEGTKHEWPDYLVFFEQLEGTMHVLLRGSGYVECWRGFNTHWHDDWRRKGDIVAWCLWPERSITHPPKEKRRPAQSKREIEGARALKTEPKKEKPTSSWFGGDENKRRSGGYTSWMRGLWPWRGGGGGSKSKKGSGWWKRSQWA